MIEYAVSVVNNTSFIPSRMDSNQPNGQFSKSRYVEYKFRSLTAKVLNERVYVWRIMYNRVQSKIDI